jgi:hypothetical protein
MATCDRCGDPVETKNSTGHYRDKCWSCIEAVADEETSHREMCDDPDCVVCAAP